jgi:hypothetical protein
LIHFGGNCVFQAGQSVRIVILSAKINVNTNNNEALKEVETHQWGAAPTTLSHLPKCNQN